MTHSIRLRFVDWLKGVIDQVTNLRVKHLRKLEVKPQSAADVGFGRAVPVHDALRQRYVNYSAANNSTLREQGGHHGRNVPVHDDPVYITYLDGLSRPNHDFLSHQTSPLGKNYLSLIANEGEVESAPSDMRAAS